MDGKHTEPGDGWVILWRPENRNEWELWRGQEGGVKEQFVKADQSRPAMDLRGLLEGARLGQAGEGS